MVLRKSALRARESSAIIQELAKRIEREEDRWSDNQSSDSLSSESEDDSEEEDCVLAENGISSSEQEEESTEEEETRNFNVNTTTVYTRSGRRATRIQI